MFRKITTALLAGTLLASAALGAAQESRTAITTGNAGQLQQLMRLGRGSAEFAQFVGDGSMLAVGGTVGVWLYKTSNLATEAEPQVLLTEGEPRAIAVSPDGATIAVSSFGGDVQLWNVASAASAGLLEPSYGTDNMVYSPDGSTLALNAGSNGILLLDAASGSETQLDGSFRSEAEVAFSPDGAWLAAAGSDNTIYLWDVASSVAGAELSGHTSTPVSIAISPDGTVVSGSSDRSIRLWNGADGSEVAVIDMLNDEQIGRINQVAFSPDGAVFASGDSDGNIVIWDTASQTPSAQFSAEAAIDDLAFSPDGSQLVSVSDEQVVQLWDVAAGTEVAATVGHTDTMNALTFSPDSGTLAVSDYDENLWLWDTAAMPELNLSTSLVEGGNISSENLTGVAYSSDGALLAALDSFSVRLYDAGTNQLMYELEGDGITEGLAFSPDDTMLAAITSAGLYVFDVSNGALLASLEDHNDWLNSVAWSPDQTLIATSSGDQTVRVYGLGE